LRPPGRRATLRAPVPRPPRARPPTRTPFARATAEALLALSPVRSGVAARAPAPRPPTRRDPKAASARIPECFSFEARASARARGLLREVEG
jgi:hypothetical protein